MAISYYVLEIKKSKGTATTEETWNAKLSTSHVTEVFANTFYTKLQKVIDDYCADDTLANSIKTTIEEINTATSNTARYTAYKKLANKFSDNSILIGYVDTAWTLMNQDLKDDSLSGNKTAMVNQDAYETYYKDSIKPEYSYVKYLREKLFAGKEPDPYATGKTPRAKKPVETEQNRAGKNQTEGGDQNTVKNIKEIATPRSATHVNRFVNFLGRKVPTILISLMGVSVIGVAFIPSTLFAVSILSFFALAMVAWGTTLAVTTITSLRHPIKRNKLREKSIRLSNLSIRNLKTFNYQLNAFQKLANEKHADGATNMFKTAYRNLKQSLDYLDRSLTNLSALYDVVKKRAQSLSNRNKANSMDKLKNIPIAVSQYVQAFGTMEIAIRKYNDVVNAAKKQVEMKDVEARKFDSWNDIKKDSYKYFGQELNQYYIQNGLVRNPDNVDEMTPRLISSTGEAIAKAEWLEIQKSDTQKELVSFIQSVPEYQNKHLVDVPTPVVEQPQTEESSDQDNML